LGSGGIAPLIPSPRH